MSYMYLYILATLLFRPNLPWSFLGEGLPSTLLSFSNGQRPWLLTGSSKGVVVISTICPRRTGSPVLFFLLLFDCQKVLEPTSTTHRKICSVENFPVPLILTSSLGSGLCWSSRLGPGKCVYEGVGKYESSTKVIWPKRSCKGKNREKNADAKCQRAEG